MINILGVSPPHSHRHIIRKLLHEWHDSSCSKEKGREDQIDLINKKIVTIVKEKHQSSLGIDIARSCI